MTCNVCGNTTEFVVTGHDVRRLTAGSEPDFYFYVTKAVCANTNCAQHPTTDVTLDPAPPELALYVPLLDL